MVWAPGTGVTLEDEGQHHVLHVVTELEDDALATLARRGTSTQLFHKTFSCKAKLALHSNAPDFK